VLKLALQIAWRRHIKVCFYQHKKAAASEASKMGQNHEKKGGGDRKKSEPFFSKKQNVLSIQMWAQEGEKKIGLNASKPQVFFFVGEKSFEHFQSLVCRCQSLKSDQSKFDSSVSCPV
jgi:hypothetical protein